MRLRIGLLTCVVAGLALLAAGPAAGDEHRIEDHFSEREIARHDRYRTPVQAIGITSLGIEIGVLAALGLGAGARGLAGWFEKVLGRRWRLRAALLAIAMVVVPTIIQLPLIGIRHAHDRTFGLATNSGAGAMRDVAVATGFRAVIGALAAVAFVWIARRLPRLWPIVTAALAAAFVFASVFLFPLVYEPAFNRFEPVDAETRERVVAIAEEAGVAVDEVLVADASRRTTAQNAYVSGLGGSKRVVLYDTLLEERSPRQVDVVVAHELAHEAAGDVGRGALYGAAAAAAAVLILRLLLTWPRVARTTVGDAGDPGIVPFLAFYLVLASVVVSPVAGAISRQREAAADRVAIRLTEDPEAAIALEVALARANLSDLTPNPVLRWAFATHPTTQERIAIALEERARLDRD